MRHETFRAKGSYAGPKQVAGGLERMTELEPLLRPEDMGRDAIQMRKFFRSLTPEYQNLALELVKTMARAQPKS